jgi:multiple antibiotic resistance protein
MNPFVALPIFLTLTGGYEVARQKKTALRVTLYSLVMALVILVEGKAILGFFVSASTTSASPAGSCS